MPLPVNLTECLLSDIAENAARISYSLVFFHDEPLLYEPGAGFTYSGLGYSILAKVVETLSGRSYEEFLREEIFEPIGMSDTGADTPDVVLKNRASGYVLESAVVKNAPAIFMPIVTGGGNLYFTVEDLSRWDNALSAQRLISPRSYESIYRPELDNYAYGWVVGDRKGERTLRHGGDVSGFGSYILRIPDEHLCVIVLSNIEHTETGQIAFHLADMVLDTP